MTRSTAIQVVIQQIGSSALIHANGMIARESCAISDREENFYMLGSMGLASAIGLGVALARPSRQIVVLDGDGNMLMNLAGAEMIAAYKPANLLHIVLDNESYGSTGGQKTISSMIALDKVAKALGYATVSCVEKPKELESEVRKLQASPGPSFILVKIRDQATVSSPRIEWTAEQIKQRFAHAIRD